jgi:phosphoribosylglycinamide formyltransferase-1
VRVAVLASGRGSNFDALERFSRTPGSPAHLALVVCDRPGAEVTEKARRAGIEVFDLDPGTRKGPWSEAGVRSLLEALAAARVEAICLAGFMRVLPAEIVRAYPGRILNIHPSLLPSFPGLHPQRQALRAGVKISGCTVHLVDEGVDTGPILAQAAVPVMPEDDEASLAARILEQEHRIYPEVLAALAQGRVKADGSIARIETGVSP